MSIVENDPEADQTIKNMNAILLAVAYGHWDEAAASAQNLLKSDDVDIIVCFTKADCMTRLMTLCQAINNLAVTLLSQGKLSQVSVISSSPHRLISTVLLRLLKH